MRVQALYRRYLLQCARNAAERCVQIGAEALNDGDDRDRDTGGDEAVLDGRRSRLVLEESNEKTWHGSVLGLLVARAGRMRGTPCPRVNMFGQFVRRRRE